MKFVKVEIYNQTGKFVYINLDNVSSINKNFEDGPNNQNATIVSFVNNERYILVMETPEEILGIDMKSKLDNILK